MLTVQAGSEATIDPSVYAKIFEKRPLLKEVLESRGQEALNVFVAANLKKLPQPSAQRKAEFVSVMREVVAERLGGETAEAFATQLDHYYGASSADHHGSINSSLAVSSNLMLAAGFDALRDPVLRYIPVLSCASVSLNNEDYPRGLLFHNAKGELQKLSLLPSNAHSCLVYNFRPYTAEEVSKLDAVLREKMREGAVSADEAEQLKALLNDVYKNPSILAAQDVCTQFTQVNVQLWKRYFKAENQQDLVYVELEEVVCRLLVQVHCDESTALHHFIFDEACAGLRQSLAEAMERYLRQGMLATHLFWGISEKNYRIKLMLEAGELVSEDRSIRVPFTPEGVKHGLQSKILMPNLLTAYTLIHLYYGFNCLGGFNQMHYLDAMQKVYNESGVDPEPAHAKSRLYHYGLETLFKDGTPVLGVDLYLNKVSWRDLLKGYSQLHVEEAFRSSAPIVYDILAQDS